MRISEDLYSLFPADLKRELRECLLTKPDLTEEIRCRIAYPISVVERGMVRSLNTCVVKAEHLDYLIERATNASLHAYSEEIQNGYLFTPSGFRIGLCGTITCNSRQQAGIRDLTSVSIRIPRAVSGCADRLLPKLMKDGFRSTIVFSPPGYGKTTLLRELIRKLSSDGLRVSVADERGEIAAVSGRRRFFDLGPNTDVMTGGNKWESAMMLLRAMNPQVLAFDEITNAKDMKAIAQAAGCGCILLATAHAQDRASVYRRSLYRHILGLGVFERMVWIQMKNGQRDYVVEDVP